MFLDKLDIQMSAQGFVVKSLKTLVLSVSMLGAGLAVAEAPDWQQAYTEGLTARAANLEIDEDYALGVGRFDLDEHTEIIGWQVSDSWFLGRQDGLDSGLTLVWQKEANQVSLSKDGLRLTRRF